MTPEVRKFDLLDAPSLYSCLNSFSCYLEGKIDYVEFEIQMDGRRVKVRAVLREMGAIHRTHADRNLTVEANLPSLVDSYRATQKKWTDMIIKFDHRKRHDTLEFHSHVNIPEDNIPRGFIG